ncbi:MAG: hypothetical protein K0Q95_2660 [Bacteroidota bacterium]|jgi:hypothetical protein|nr:hypothetical protein [Bacteroidota bacterium]
MRLKNIISCLLIFFVSLLYNIETVKFIIKSVGDNSIAWIDDGACEGEKEKEESKESEESSKKGESVFLDDDFLQQEMINESYLSVIGNNQNHNFSSSDYSLEIYCPPEMA